MLSELRDKTPLWHTMPCDEVLKALDTSPSGLSQQEAKERQCAFGANRLPQTAKRSAVVRFLLQFHNILIYVLLGSALITAVLGHWVDTVVIIAVVTANACIGFIQEGKAEKAMDAIRKMLAPHARVIRDGQRSSIDGAGLVPGDIVLLEAGEKVPADIRLLETDRLIVQESILTGESAPVEKYIGAIEASAALGDRSCMLYSGTMIAGGQGQGVVIATGSSTEIGRISHLLTDVEELTTPLIKQMGTFAQRLTVIILLLALLLLIYGYLFGLHDFSEIFMAVVGLSVAAIPEGLPAVMTITLAVGVQVMAKQQAIVRRLPAIETLGSVSVICTDKTGTLTRNEMMVASVLTAHHFFEVTGEGYRPVGDLLLDNRIIKATDFSGLEALGTAATLCNDAALIATDQDWQVVGDPMEGALLTFAQKSGVDLARTQSHSPRVHTIPFDARYRMMATEHAGAENSRIIYVKGAPEQILASSKAQLSENGHIETIQTDQWNQRAEAIAGQGQRVLALAFMQLAAAGQAPDYDDLNGHLILIGMVGLIDPPRSEAITAVATCQKAGIQVKMITGDHAKTAAAIGQQVGLKNTTRVLTGQELDQMDDATLADAILSCDVFARTSPEHKLRLVMALQSHQRVVAMTGDGVNDTPALKRADAGIAMGKNGSEAAKEAADLVLADDNFATIAVAVREGRTVYDNIKKVLSWTLPTNAGEAGAVIVALLSGLALPITPIQILWVNLITAITLGIALAFEPSEPGTMQRPPRPREEALLSGSLVWHIILVAALFIVAIYGVFHHALENGQSIDTARTLALNTLVTLEIFHLFFIRNMHATQLNWQALRATPIVWTVVGIVVAAQLTITYTPAFQQVFNTVSMPISDFVLIILIGVVFFAIIETEKRIRYRLGF